MPSTQRLKNIARIIADAARTHSVRAIKKISGECIYRYCPKHGVVMFFGVSKMDDFLYPKSSISAAMQKFVRLSAAPGELPIRHSNLRNSLINGSHPAELFLPANKNSESDRLSNT